MSSWLLVLCGIVGVALLWWWSRMRFAQPSEPAGKGPASLYRCVSIRPSKDACASVRRLGDQRFLSREAPPLPLETCDTAVCRSRYAQNEDRREGERRSSHALKRGLNSGSDNSEFRTGRDRRRSPGFASRAVR